MEKDPSFPAHQSIDDKKKWESPRLIKIEKNVIASVPVPGIVDAGAYIS